MKGNISMHNRVIKVRKCLSGLLISALLLCSILIAEPVSIYAADSSDGVVYICTNFWRSAAIKSDGSLWMWGGNNNTPTKVMDGVKAVGLGNNHTAVIKTDGSLWMWGANNYGQLGNGSCVDSNKPIKIMDGVKDVCLGRERSAAIKTDGSLWMWGYDTAVYPYDGDPYESYFNTPVKVMDDVEHVDLDVTEGAAIKTDGSLWRFTGFSSPPSKVMDDVKAFSQGQMHYAALKKDGSLWMWGYAYCGRLGNGDNSGSTYNTPFKLMDGVKAVSLGETHSAAIKTDGSLWMWGLNDYGEFGIGNTTDSSIPIKVMDGVEAVSLDDFSSAVIKADGSLWMWGYNGNGQLGDGTFTPSLVPKRVFLGSNNGNNSTPTGSNSSNTGKRVSSAPSVVKNPLFGVKLKKVSKGKKSFTAKWKKASKKQQKKFSGYQIQYSTDWNFRTGIKTKSTTKKKASKVVIRKLKAKTNYYVRIRRFKKSGGKVVYSDWSNVKKVRTK